MKDTETLLGDLLINEDTALKNAIELRALLRRHDFTKYVEAMPKEIRASVLEAVDMYCNMRGQVYNLQVELASCKTNNLYDTLTGCLTYAAAMDQLEKLFGNFKRDKSKQLLAGIFMDINDFGNINKEHGHLFGNQVLQRFAERLRSCLQREGDVLARFGGDEFLVLLPHTDARGAKRVMEKMDTILKGTPFDIKGTRFFLTVSMGSSLADKSMVNKDDLLEQLDLQMLKNKVAFKESKRVSFYNVA